MNQRIEELAEQANLEIDPAYPDHNQKVLENLLSLLSRNVSIKLKQINSVMVESLTGAAGPARMSLNSISELKNENRF